ncbi:MAG: hypothetical protein COB02_01795 [Candidatus Cloacimonadota bacterium]|nr:MAG: hypothetical protein COB02_01795 [Candidatus Cloacimonadota bacterium]
MKKFNLTPLKTMISGFAIASILSINPINANETSEIEKLELKLLQVERNLLSAELENDDAIKDYHQFKGIRGWIKGWFKGSEKRAILSVMDEKSKEIDQLDSEVSRIESGIQAEVFEVGLGFENQGDYKKAIEFYKKVTRKDDRVKLRIGTCYQNLKNYKEAITWYLQMSNTDENYLYIVDAYWESGSHKDAINWLFRILEPYSGYKAELKALQLIEEYNYNNKFSDFEDFNVRLSDVYLDKALTLYDDFFKEAVVDYKKAMTLRSDGDSAAKTSRGVVRYYSRLVQEAKEVLDEKREEAYHHYEYLLHQAEDNVRDAEYTYNQKFQEAKRDYRWAIERAKQNVRDARKNLRALRENESTLAEDLQRAEVRVKTFERKFNYLLNNEPEFIENEVRRYRIRVHEEKNAYQRLVHSREQIISDYIEPYRRKVARSKRNYNQIVELHSSAFDDIIR